MTELDGAALDRARGEHFQAHASRAARVVELVRHWLPKGQLLPEHIWRRRHQTIVWLLWCHVVGLTAFGLFQGQSVPHMMLEGGFLALPALPPRSGSSPLRRSSSTCGAGSSRRTSTSS